MHRELMVVPRGLEPRTLRLLAVRSNQLSYETLALILQVPFAQRFSDPGVQRTLALATVLVEL